MYLLKCRKCFGSIDKLKIKNLPESAIEEPEEANSSRQLFN